MTAITLSDMGSYMVGGNPIEITGRPLERFAFSSSYTNTVDPNGRYWANHCYVQYFVPEPKLHPIPLVLVHGGGLTGSSWETTPDGRAGWLNYFLRLGYEVHVIDNVERGRAGYFIDGEPWSERPILRSEQESWWLYRFGLAEDFGARKPFAGQQFPVEHIEALTRITVPRRSAVADLQRFALHELVKKLGRCVLVGHSQGGGFVLDTAACCPRNVVGCVVLEPHADFIGIDLGGVAGIPLLAITGDFIDRSAVWIDLTEQLAKLCESWSRAGGRAQHLLLPDIGISGNSHMIMMDKNSDEIAGHVADWLERSENNIAALVDIGAL
ncbi:pimeloyl-ACP methyl ester carboxylesterase [Rhodoligotrophos appendicifer]|uniref:alpha/beta fold hydrolase n=1 Tax=Rhodoligotrophos appendicifer TaxID=987056 RepID=UPI00118537D4|nr:alpha/beta fold hydrolase [Rhodoligotrophos appendicifer]